MNARHITNASEVAAALPDIPMLLHRCRALAMLEAIISPDWDARYYSFDNGWADGEQMASMRNGSGDEYSVVFTGAGVFIRGLDHESRMSPAANDDELWPGLIDAVPAVFDGQVNEPAFSYDGVLQATFCLWRQSGDSHWHVGDIEYPAVAGYRTDPDGAGLLNILCDASGDLYRAFAADYYETEPDPTAVQQIYAGKPLDDAMVGALNAELTLADVRAEAAAIGYPVTG